MLQLTMHSPVMGAAVIPEAFTQIRAMPPRRINAPEELKASTELTVQSCCIANPNGGKLSALGTRRRRFEPSRSNSNHRGMRSTPSFFARGFCIGSVERHRRSGQFLRHALYLGRTACLKRGRPLEERHSHTFVAPTKSRAAPDGLLKELLS